MAKLSRKYYETKQRSLRNIEEDISDGIVSDKLEIQRGIVWTNEQIELFIDSLVKGFISIHLVHIILDEIEYICDGLQRETTIKKYLNDEIVPIQRDYYIKYISVGKEKSTNLRGQRFSELPKPVQDMIKNIEVSIDIYEGLSNIEICELFNRLNGGTKLTIDWGYRVVIFSINKELLKISDDIKKKYKEFFSIVMKESDIKRGMILTNIIKACMLLREDKYYSLDSKRIVEYLENDFCASDLGIIEKCLSKIEHNGNSIKYYLRNKTSFVPYVIYGAIFADDINGYLANINGFFRKGNEGGIYTDVFNYFNNHTTSNKCVRFRRNLVKKCARYSSTSLEDDKTIINIYASLKAEINI